MSETEPMPTAAPTADPSATERESWFQQMEEHCLEDGYFEPMGGRHWAFFHDDGPVLLVTFETIDSILARPDRLSYGHSVAAAKGWSHLCIVSDGVTWYRDAAVYRYFDRLVDDSFFEDFDRVVFYGAGPAGYAACAFSVAAPGATVLAIQPRATLSPAVAGWDDRHRAARRLDFASRYGFAPDMVEGAEGVYLIHDPQRAEDSMHVALFRAPHVTALRTPYLGDRIEETLIGLGILPRLLTEAGEGRMSAQLFARLWRKRGSSLAYMDGLIAKAQAQGKDRRVWRIAGEAAERVGAQRYRRLLARLAPVHGVATGESVSSETA